MYEQDGVAPQCAVGGIDKSKRVFITEKYADGTEIPKNFLDSHSIDNYKWIFDYKKGKDEKGYIDKKN
jgi:hypothetical protein